MKAKTFFPVAIALLFFFSCKKEQTDLPKRSHKDVFSFIISEPSLNLEISCGRQLSFPGRISGLVCPAFYGTTTISQFLFKSSLSYGATIAPVDSSWVDFSSPVQFTVTAEDGSDTTFWVTVGTVEGFWLKDGAIVDTMKFELEREDWRFGNYEINANTFFGFSIGQPCKDRIGATIHDWHYEDLTDLPKTFSILPGIEYRVAGCAFNGGDPCTDCTLTITELDLERGVFSGTWNLSFYGDVVNGSVGSFKNAPLYGKY